MSKSNFIRLSGLQQHTNVTHGQTHKHTTCSISRVETTVTNRSFALLWQVDTIRYLGGTFCLGQIL